MMIEYEDCIRRINRKIVSEKYAFDMGVDCARNGANEKNCHFSIFSTPENTKAWEKGKKDEEKA